MGGVGWGRGRGWGCEYHRTAPSGTVSGPDCSDGQGRQGRAWQDSSSSAWQTRPSSGRLRLAAWHPACVTSGGKFVAAPIAVPRLKP